MSVSVSTGCRWCAINNAKYPTLSTIDLDLFGGLFTEANPADLPPGASPQAINCDFIVGTVKQRPGKQSEFYYSEFFAEKLPAFADTVPGALAPNETAWADPTNVELDTPGTYASVTLNPSGGGSGTFDKAASGNGSVSPVAVSATPSITGEYAIFAGTLATSGAVGTLQPDGTWSTDFDNGLQAIYTKQLTDGATVNISKTITNQRWSACLAFFGSSGSPVIVQSRQYVGTFNSGLAGPGPVFISPTTPGSVLVCVFSARGSNLNRTPAVTSDTQGNTWHTAALDSNGTAGLAAQTAIMYAENTAGGSAPTLSMNLPSSSGSLIEIFEITGLVPVANNDVSEVLESLNFGFGIPSTTDIIGVQVEIGGNQSSIAADAILTVQLANGSGNLGTPKTAQLGLVDGLVTVGLPMDNWGITLTPALFNDPNFTVNVVASALSGTNVTFSLYAVKLKVWLTPDPPPSINYIKTFSQTSGQVNTLALGDDGIMFQEDVTNNEGVLTGVYTAIEPNTFAQSATQADREFIALSDLLNGTDIPYSYNGTNFDRLSQVGPGAAPTCSSSSTGSAITSITQNAAVALLTGAHDWLLVSDSPSDHGTFGTPSTPGNVCTLIFRNSTTVPSYITPGTNIVLAGFPTINGNQLSNDPTGVAAPAFYTVTSVGQPIPGEYSYDAITFTVRFTTFYAKKTPGGCTIQSTTATMTTATQVPNLEVGNQFLVSGTGGSPPSGYDGTWTATATPNASQMLITSTVLSGNVATYGFTLVTGTAPVVGQAVTVVQTLNGNGVFNVVNAIITAVSGGTFSVTLVGADISSEPESGSAIIFGTIFEFDPLQIVGDIVGGTVITAGVIASGHRKICYSFLTRDGYITQPSPIFEFDVPAGGASTLAVANLAVGPSNVIARIIHFTAAEGGNFYNIPKPVTVLSNGSNVTNSSTWVLDNTTTNVVLSFSDDVLLSALQIDVQGNNLFETAELGSSLGFIPYANRLFAIGEQNKLTNLLNWSFDGGIGIIQSTTGSSAGFTSKYPRLDGGRDERWWKWGRSISHIRFGVQHHEYDRNHAICLRNDLSGSLPGRIRGSYHRGFNGL